MAAATNGSTERRATAAREGRRRKRASKLDETALGNAAGAGNAETVKLLLDRGADVNSRNSRGYSPLMLAAGSDAMNAEIVKLLIAKGADTSFSADYDETAHILAEQARRHAGDTPARRRPRKAGSNRERAVASHNVARVGSPAKAIEAALPLLEKQSHNFIRIGGCNSCHAQDLVSAAAAIARDRGIPGAARDSAASAIDDAVSRTHHRSERGRLLRGVAWELFDFGMNKLPKTAYTDAAVRLPQSDADPGRELVDERRPPPADGVRRFPGCGVVDLRPEAIWAGRRQGEHRRGHRESGEMARKREARNDAGSRLPPARPRVGKRVAGRDQDRGACACRVAACRWRLEPASRHGSRTRTRLGRRSMR